MKRQTRRKAASSCEHSGVRMSEHHRAMHNASHYGNALWMQSMGMPLLQPGSTTDSFVTNGGFIVGSYTLPTYYFALLQS